MIRQTKDSFGSYECCLAQTKPPKPKASAVSGTGINCKYDGKQMEGQDISRRCEQWGLNLAQFADFSSAEVRARTGDDDRLIRDLSTAPEEHDSWFNAYLLFSIVKSLAGSSTIKFSDLQELDRLGPGVDLSSYKIESGATQLAAFKFNPTGGALRMQQHGTKWIFWNIYQRIPIWYRWTALSWRTWSLASFVSQPNLYCEEHWVSLTFPFDSSGYSNLLSWWISWTWNSESCIKTLLLEIYSSTLILQNCFSSTGTM